MLKHVVKQTLTHDCPQQGRVTLTTRWLPDAKQLRATCDKCDCAVYAERDGEQVDTTEMVV
jgi:hypothetical protein